MTLRRQLKASKSTRDKRNREESTKDAIRLKSHSYNAVERLDTFRKQRSFIESTLSEQLNVSADQLAMNRGNEWRERIETLEEISASLPLYDRHLGNAQWKMSLRDAWEHWIPVGNPMTGLYTAIHDDTRKLCERGLEKVYCHGDGIQRDRTSYTEDVDHGKGPSLSSRNRSWQHSTWLQQKKHQQKNLLERTSSHQPDCSELLVVGHSIEEDSGSTRTGACHPENLSKTPAPKNPDLPQIPVEQSSQQDTSEDKSVAADFVLCGPNVRLSRNDLLLVATGQDIATEQITLENIGTSAVYYEWNITDTLHKISTRNQKTKGSLGPFYIDEKRGVILPSELKTFRISFSAVNPASYSAQYTLLTKPPCKSSLDLTLFVRGMSFSADNLQEQRVLTETDLLESCKTRTVKSIIETILQHARRIVEKNFMKTKDNCLERTAFLRNNQSCLPTIFCRKTTFTEMTELHASVLNIWKMLSTAKEPTSTGSKGKPQHTEPRPADPVPEDWDLKATTIQKLISNIRNKNFAAAYRAQSHLNTLMHKASFPPDRSCLYQIAILRCMTKFIEGIDDLTSNEETLPRRSSLQDPDQHVENTAEVQTSVVYSRIRAMLLESLTNVEQEIGLLLSQSRNKLKFN